LLYTQVKNILKHFLGVIKYILVFVTASLACCPLGGFNVANLMGIKWRM
jgi:hypothetical protein